MCDGNHSSAIRAHRENRLPMPRLYSDDFLESTRPYLAHLDQAKFLGGEPFLVTEHFRLWDMMIEDCLTTAGVDAKSGDNLIEDQRDVRRLSDLPKFF